MTTPSRASSSTRRPYTPASKTPPHPPPSPSHLGHLFSAVPLPFTFSFPPWLTHVCCAVLWCGVCGGSVRLLHEPMTMDKFLHDMSTGHGDSDDGNLKVSGM